tara:strand:+ start:42945 stop:44873 length:1929 start_codon:yes stop_codon:yes gene_type:complete
VIKIQNLLILFYINFCFSQHIHENILWNNSIEAVDENNNNIIGVFNNFYVDYEKEKFSNSYFIFETHHFKNKLSGKEGFELINLISILKTDSIEIIDVKARHISQDSTILYDFKNIKKLLENEYSSENFTSYRIPNMEIGDYLEVIYTIKKNYTPNGSKILEETYPIYNSKVFIIHNDLYTKAKVYNFRDYTIRDSIINNKKSKVYEFQKLKETIDEQYSAQIANKVKISYRTAMENDADITEQGYWQNLVENTKNLFFPSNKNENVNILYDSIIDNRINSLNKLRIIDIFIKNNIVVSSENNPKLNDLNYIIKNRMSSDFSKIQLYTHLLKKADIEYEVLISCNRYYMKFDKDFFDPSQLREILIYVPSLNKYIVPNRYEYGIGEPPDDVLGNYAIYIDQNLDYYFSEIISENNDFTKIKKNINVKFSNQIRSKRVKIEETREYHGYWSINNRNYIYFSNEEISPFLKDFFTVSGLENKKIKEFNSNYNSIQDNYYNIPLIINSSIETFDLIKENQKNMYSFEVGKLIGLQSNLFDETSRVNDIEINFPNEYEYRIRIRIPKGFEPMGISSLNMTSKYSAVSGEIIAYFHSRASIEGKFLQIEISEYYRSLYYDKSKYDDFSNVINTAANFYEKTIDISKN